jgi:hypothetical protein
MMTMEHMGMAHMVIMDTGMAHMVIMDTGMAHMVMPRVKAVLAVEAVDKDKCKLL